MKLIFSAMLLSFFFHSCKPKSADDVKSPPIQIEDYLSRLSEIEDINAKDEYFFQQFDNDYPLKRESTIKLIEATKSYKTNSNVIKLLQIKLPDTPYEQIQKRSTFFYKLIKEKKLELEYLSFWHFAEEVAALHAKHDNKPLTILWLKIGAKSTPEHEDKARIYDSIGDLFSELKEYSDSIKNYKISLKHSDNKSVKEKIENINKMLKEK